MPSIYDFATWEPLVTLVRNARADTLAAPGGHVSGSVSRGGFTMPLPAGGDGGYAMFGVTAAICDALGEAGLDSISYVIEGRSTLHLLTYGPAVETGIGTYPGALVFVDGARPEPWRRGPDPVPGAAPAASADPDLLERTLRARLPEAIGATGEEIAAAEARLGVALPAEVRALYRVTRGNWWQDFGDDYAALDRMNEAVGCEPRSLDQLYIADIASRPSPWGFAATEAVVTPPDAAVQGLVGSPGWIVFGDNGGGDRLTIDLTPGPGGHVGQVIVLDHEQSIGANLVADSLTDLVVHRQRAWHPADRAGQPFVARVNSYALDSVEGAVHPDLEVLQIGVTTGDPRSLAPVVGLPRLRTLTAYPGTLADPVEVAKLTGLEFLELGPADWRVLLDAGAVPRQLSAAALHVPGTPHPLPIVALANELLALWDRPPITRTTLD